MPVVSQRPSTTALPSSQQLERSIQRGDNVEIGSDGAAVREAQKLLVAHGYNVQVDSDFGSGTKGAIEAFQRSRGIDVDGIIGPETLRELRTPTGGVDRRSGSDAGVVARPQDRIPGQTGADLQRQAQIDAGRRQTPSTTTTTPNAPARSDGHTPVTVAPATMTQAQKFEHYRNIVMQNGGQDPRTSDRPVVLGVRGMDRSGNAHETRNRAQYDDTMVVLNRNGTVTELRGNTHAGQVTSSLVSSVGMIRSGNFEVVPNGPHAGAPSFHVRQNGSGSLPGIRDTNHDGRFSDAEVRSRQTMTEILFHQGTEASPHSIGCQTLSPSEYRRFLGAVGSRGFSYTLVDANGRT
jgi:peptidoglycan hydrolase-like protein with peptidoglycan-binding domain